MTLSAADIAVVADAVCARLRGSLATRSGWVDAATVAAHLGVDPSYVYDNADRIGGVRLGDGPKARLRFRLDLVDASLCSAGRESDGSTSAPGAGSRRRAASSATASARSLPVSELLPIRGRTPR